MNVTGIIAEYNPFHNGHAFHIEETRKNTDADYCIAVISGDFVQRGAPALLNKYDRAKMALENGIDLVIELPVIRHFQCGKFCTGWCLPVERAWCRVSDQFWRRSKHSF
jgi:predicted nucleotidyltransferase